MIALALPGDKGHSLAGGIRAPFFVSWPGQQPGGNAYPLPVTALHNLPTA
jgi:arylsulfatase A-like enzyme